MLCPNCTTSFVLRADYATHLWRCRPADAKRTVTDALLVRLNDAATRLQREFDRTDDAGSTLHPAA